MLAAAWRPRDDGLDRDFAGTGEPVFRQVHAAKQQQVLDLADPDDSLFRGRRGGKKLDRGQGGGLPRVGGIDFGHVAQRDHRPGRVALGPQPQFGSRGDDAASCDSTAVKRQADNDLADRCMNLRRMLSS